MNARATSTSVAFLCAWSLSLITLPANAHTMTVTRGTVVITDKSLTLTWAFPAEDLLHAHALSPKAIGSYAIKEVIRAAESYGQTLRRRIVVRDGKGGEIDGLLKSCTLDREDALDVFVFNQNRVSCTVDYALNEANRYLSFQQVARGGDAVSPSGIVLSVRSNAASVNMVRLTSGGNVEVVRILADSSDVGGATGAEMSGCSPESFANEASQRTVRAIVAVHDRGVRLDLFMPIPLLETWLAIPRARRDYLEFDEQLRAKTTLTSFLGEENQLSIDGERVAGRMVGIEFLDVDEFGGRAAGAKRRLSAWTSRVRITVDYPSSRRPGSIDLRWTLFNASVLTAQTLIRVNGVCFRQDVSTYDSHLTWKAK